MKKINNLFKLCLSIFVMCGIIFSSSALTINAKAEEVEQYDKVITVELDGNARGLFADINLGLDGENGYVSAHAYNVFTLFPSTIRVYVELYSSTVYQESYEDMTLMGMAYDNDLDMYETLTYSEPTRGVAKYWHARMRFKFDTNDWVEKSTGTFLYDADANIQE